MTVPWLVLLACSSGLAPGDPSSPVVDSATDDAAPPEDDCSPVEEVCDGVDNDCDALIDEPDATDAVDWYRDADRDGFGDSDASVTGCDRPPGYVREDGDCDDESELAYPGAEEICADSVDNDCDGDVSECALFGEVEFDALLTGLADLDRVGTAFAGMDLNGDGRESLLIGVSEHDANGRRDSGAIFAAELPLSERQDLGDPILRGESASIRFGYAIGAGDFGHDGVDDLLVGVPGDGEVRLFTAPLDAPAALISAEALDHQVGEAVFVSGDWMAIGAPGFGGGDTPDRGAVYLIQGAGPLADAPVRFVGPERTARIGAALAGSDVDGDGTDDVVIGAPQGGQVWVADPTDAGDVVLSVADAFSGGDRLGAAISAGDVDQDGYGDVLMGAPDAAGTLGEAYLIAGPIAVVDLSAAVAVFQGLQAGDVLGEAVSCDRDFDGDGAKDVVIGAPGDRARAAEAGRVMLYYGPVSGAQTTDTFDVRMTGTQSRQRLGSALAFVEMAGNGLHAVVAGAPGDRLGGDAAGAVMVLQGAGL
ncbi:MAG: MopE-related protein [Myxococcota bacterium]